MGITNIKNLNNLSNLASSLLSGTSNQQTSTLFDYLDNGDNASGTSSLSDILDISPQAQVAADKLNNSDLSTDSLLSSLFGTRADGTQIDNLQEAADQAFAKVQSKLNKLFKQYGIDTSKEIKLQVGSDGQVIVANDHPQKKQIEQLFKDDPTLRDDFVKFSVLSETIAASQESLAFQEAYAKDPVAAVAKYSYLFDANNKGVLSMSILSDKFQSLFERAGKDPLVISKSA
jgi:hypothetical protein